MVIPQCVFLMKYTPVRFRLTSTTAVKSGNKNGAGTTQMSNCWAVECLLQMFWPVLMKRGKFLELKCFCACSDRYRNREATSL
jgi:hypothetical protein